MPDSSVVKGMVLRRDTEGTLKLVKDAKVAVFAQVGVIRALCKLWLFVVAPLLHTLLWLYKLDQQQTLLSYSPPSRQFLCCQTNLRASG